MPVDSTSKTALVYTSIRVDPKLLSRYTGATSVQTAEFDKGWLHLLECSEPKAYDEFSEALIATETYLKTSCFLPILDDAGCTDGKLILNPSFEHGAFNPTTTWRAQEGLSKQVKFAADVHRSDGKRKREQAKKVIQNKDKKSVHPSSFAEKALDAVSGSHTAVVAAKDETIRALTNALIMKDELIRTQAALISALQA